MGLQTNSRLAAHYHLMRRIRTFEERVGELFVRGQSAGSMLHLSIGTEAPAVGVGSNMRDGDTFTTHHRGHGVFLARGTFVGLTLSHEPHHIFRAIMEGVCFGTRTILNGFKDGDYTSTEMTVGGGATASRLWMQIHADTAGIPVRIPESIDAPSTGSAILAAHGAGHFASIDEGIDAMVKPGVLIEPDPAATAAYENVYQQYRALYPALKQIREKTE